MHSDRLVMLNERKVDVEKLELEECNVKKKSASSVETADASTVELLQSKIGDVAFKKSFAVKTVSLSSVVVTDYESTI